MREMTNLLRWVPLMPEVSFRSHDQYILTMTSLTGIVASLFCVIDWIISLKVKVIVSWISPTFPTVVSASELMVVPGGTSPILTTLPIISWVDDVILKYWKRI